MLVHVVVGPSQCRVDAEEVAIYSSCLLGAGAEVLEDERDHPPQVRLHVEEGAMRAYGHPYGEGLRVLLPGRPGSLFKMIVWMTTKRMRLNPRDLDLDQ